MSDSRPNQFALLRQRRFAPFFWTQFAGAANDNLFKFAFTVLVTYQLQVAWLPPAMAGLVIGALFILPFLLFSATSGQLADKYPKQALMRQVKRMEVGIMLLAAAGFFLAHVPLLLLCVFLLGLHSTLFGPAKFAYLPQVLDERELTGGNGVVEMGTFVAILAGNVAGGLLMAVPGVGPMQVGVTCLLLAAIGRVACAFIPQVPATAPDLRIDWNPFRVTWQNLQLARTQLTVWRSLLGISWMWFFGAVFLSLFPSFAKEVLHGDAHVASLLLAVFSMGVGIGSLLCEVLTRRHVDVGLVPFGALGMTVFALDLYLATQALPPAQALLGWQEFLARPVHWRVMADLFLLALCMGLYSVPMYALIQLRAQPTHRARIIAANNILNALFMIASALLVGAMLSLGLEVPEVILVTALLNAAVAFHIFLLVPEYLLRFLAWIATHFVYRFRVAGEHHIPTQGPALLACNHVSFVDPILLMAASPRPIYFLMDHQIFRTPVLGWVFRMARAIPIASPREDRATYEAAFERANAVLQRGDLLMIFPEGSITRNGQLQPFKAGVAKLLRNARASGVDVPVIPMALGNLWGSFFSRIDPRGAMRRPLRRGWPNRVTLEIGPALTADEASVGTLQGRVQALWDVAEARSRHPAVDERDERPTPRG